VSDSTPTPEALLDGGSVVVSGASYAICRSTRPDPTAFACVQDGEETTVIQRTDAVDREAAVDVDAGWRLLTFELTLPFELVGFLAVVAGALADAGVSMCAVSAYSTDHVLVGEADLDRAVRTLEGLGCEVREGGS
jgi:hypothetical protein